MAEISLTRFVDFVSASGPPKMTVVKNTRKQIDDEYGPEKDFYKQIREAIISMHKGGENISHLSRILPQINHDAKLKHFPLIIEGYRKWSARKGAKWFTPPHALWSQPGVVVKVNPELGLRIRNRPHLIKLYFKADKLTKNKIDIITHLMAITCASQVTDDTVVGVLDIRRSKLIKPTVPKEGLDILLRGEAAYWAAVWKDLAKG